MSKTHKTLDIFYRALKGEPISPKALKFEYGVSDRTITRHINEIKAFLAESRDLIGYAELECFCQVKFRSHIPNEKPTTLDKEKVGFYILHEIVLFGFGLVGR